jgi:tripartite ATP-independent transporter DctM subunit
MSIGLLTIIVAVLFITLLLAGLPIVFVLGGVSAVGCFILLGPNALSLISNQAYAQMDNFVAVAIPLFIFLGTLLERAGIAEDAFDLMYKSLGRIKGGLAVGTVIVCTIFAAMTGTAAAATISMGLIALPAMLKRHYNQRLAIGSIAAAGTLGVIIPPSVLMVLYGLFAGVSVGKMFAGGVFAGLTISFMFVIYILVRSHLQPNFCPELPKEERARALDVLKASKGVVFPIIIIFAVLGTIFAGVATPTEAAAVGCFGGLICAKLRGTLTRKTLRETVYRTMELSAMVIWILFASAAFTAFFARIGATQTIQDLFLMIPASPYAIIIGIMIILFILGMFIDPGAIIMLTVPIFVPVVKQLGFDPLWFGVLFVANMLVGYISPPFGFNLFYMKRIVPEGVNMAEIYKAVVPFIIIMVFCVALFILFPELILWLPNKIIK